MKKEINKVLSGFMSRASECTNVYGECIVELNSTTFKKLFKFIKDITESPEETSPVQKKGKKCKLFGSNVKFNNTLPNDFVLFNPSGRVLMLK